MIVHSLKDDIVARFGVEALKRSALSIRDGEGVLRKVLCAEVDVAVNNPDNPSQSLTLHKLVPRYRHVLEIGTYKGVAAACMARYCERVTTIDLHHGRLEQLGESWDRQAFWSKLGIHNIDLRLVNDNAEKSELVNALDFDFAFVDGAHDESVRDDFDLVKRCGTVLFHDYDRRGRPELDYVADFIDTLPKDQIEVMDIFVLWTAPDANRGRSHQVINPATGFPAEWEV